MQLASGGRCPSPAVALGGGAQARSERRLQLRQRRRLEDILCVCIRGVEVSVGYTKYICIRRHLPVGAGCSCAGADGSRTS